jgi:predicted acetyltransferase
MNRNDKVLLFLGRIQARIEDLSMCANNTKNPLWELIVELESYYNSSINELFCHDDEEFSTWRKGITWTTLPR